MSVISLRTYYLFSLIGRYISVEIRSAVTKLLHQGALISPCCWLTCTRLSQQVPIILAFTDMVAENGIQDANVFRSLNLSTTALSTYPTAASSTSPPEMYLTIITGLTAPMTIAWRNCKSNHLFRINYCHMLSDVVKNKNQSSSHGELTVICQARQRC